MAGFGVSLLKEPHGRRLLVESRSRCESVYEWALVGEVAGPPALALPPLALGRR
jgi:hypothetical protein